MSYIPTSGGKYFDSSHLPFSLAFRPDSGDIDQNGMNDAAILSIHRIKGKGMFRHPDSFGGFLRHQL
jgi:hypothetical protein